MTTEWFYLIDGEQIGPVPEEDLKELAESRVLLPADLVWTEGMADWRPASQVPGLFSAQPPPIPPTMHRHSSPGYRNRKDGDYWEFVNKKIVAGVCGIFLGSLGIHKFILGMSTPGIIMLLCTLLTCGLGGAIMGVIGMVEGIIYLTKSDDEFYELYAVEQREWF